MNYIQTVISNKYEFIQSAKFAIIYGLRASWDSCESQTPHEPDLVAGLVLESTKIIQDAWGAIFHSNNIDFSMLSIFCHQTPKVNYSKSTKSCELGDILFVHIHKNKNNSFYNNALLYQVKVSSKQPYSIPKAEEHQLQLYQNWPEFKYVNSGKELNGYTRNVMPKMAHSGAQYLLIDDRPPSDPASGLLNLPNTYPAGSCMACPTIYDHNSLENELFDFLLLKSGRPFRLYKHAQKEDGWSRVVWDLLKIGVTKTFTRKRSGIIKRPRVSSLHEKDGDFLSFATSSECFSTIQTVLGDKEAEFLFSKDSGDNNRLPPIDNDLNYQSLENGGTSLIIIETHERNG